MSLLGGFLMAAIFYATVSPNAATSSADALLAQPKMVGVNKLDLFHEYAGFGFNGKHPTFWSAEPGGPAGSETFRLGPLVSGLPEGNYALRLSAQPGTGAIVINSDQFSVTPNTAYEASAFIRKGGATGNFAVVLLDSNNQRVGEYALPLLTSGTDNGGQNWSDGWNFVQRRFSFTAPEGATVGFISLALNADASSEKIMDVDIVSVTAGFSPVSIANASFEDGNATEARALAATALDDAAGLGLKYVRFAATPYCGYDLAPWQRDPANYWQAFDQLIADAEARNMKLIPSILWNSYVFPHFVGEPHAKLFDLNSLTNQTLKQYTNELVSRYKDSPAILFWELTNELNLKADLNLNARPPDTCYGSEEPAGDKNFSSDQMITFMRDFAAYIKNIDPQHSISSGYSKPRPAAQHLRGSPEWITPDWTRDSFEEMQTWLFDTHPDPIDIISGHFYPPTGANPEWTIADLQKANSAFGKILFGGEFGDYNSDGTWKADPQYAQSVLNTVTTYRIPFSLVWVWERYKSVEPPVLHPQHNLAPGLNQHILDMIAVANQSLAQPDPADTTKPSAYFISPQANQTLSGTVPIKANASDNVRVSKVEVYSSGVLVGADSTYPYDGVTWDTTAYPHNSNQTLAVRAYDAAGNVSTDATVVVKILDIVPPTVFITSPTNNSLVSRNSKVTIQASTSDVSGIAKVEFSVNGILKCTDSATPYSCVWSVPNTKNVSYTLQAKAFDTAGNSSSAATMVTSK